MRAAMAHAKRTVLSESSLSAHTMLRRRFVFLSIPHLITAHACLKNGITHLRKVSKYCKCLNPLSDIIIARKVWYSCQDCPFVFIKGSQVIIFCRLFCLSKQVDHHEMQHYAAFHPGLHCMPKYHFWFSKG